MHIFGADSHAIFADCCTSSSSSDNNSSSSSDNSSSSSSNSVLSHCIPSQARRKYLVPGVPGAFLMTNVLCRSEVRALSACNYDCAYAFVCVLVCLFVCFFVHSSTVAFIYHGVALLFRVMLTTP